MADPTPEWVEWRQSLLAWFTEHPEPPIDDNDDGAMDGVVTAIVIITEHSVPDGGPFLHHMSSDIRGHGLATWREDGMLRQAMADVKTRIFETAEED